MQYEGIKMVSQAANAWDVEAELQKELDAVSISSHISSSSSSALSGGEEEGDSSAFRAEGNTLHRLLDEWRAKEKKLEKFENMLKTIPTWQDDVLRQVTSGRDASQNTAAMEVQQREDGDGGSGNDDKEEEDDALSLLLEEFRTEEAQRLEGKNLRRESEIEESRRIMQKQQELEEIIQKEKVEKLASLDLEKEQQKLLFEEMQRFEEWDVETQKKEMEQGSRALMSFADAYKHMEEELELRRLELDEPPFPTADQNTLTTTDDRMVKSCIFIQAWIRGFLCRRKCQDRANTRPPLHNEYEKRDIIHGEHGDMGLRGTSEEQMEVTHRHELHMRESLKDTNSCGQCQLLEVASQKCVSEAASLHDFQCCLELNVEAIGVETQLTQRKQRVHNWLEQVVLGWETKRSLVHEQIQEAKRLDLVSIYPVAESFMQAREQEISHSLQASIQKASKCKYDYWIQRARVFGMEEILEPFSKQFQKKLETVKNELKREAQFGTKEVLNVMLTNAVSLGLDVDVRTALKSLLKRVLQVFKQAILLDDDHGVQDWKRVEIEGADIGFDSQILVDLRQIILDSRSLESMKPRTCIAVFKANDLGEPFMIAHEMNNAICCGASTAIRASNLCKAASNRDTLVPQSISIWSTQNWQERSRIQQHWQSHTLGLRTAGAHQGMLENDKTCEISNLKFDEYSETEKTRSHEDQPKLLTPRQSSLRREMLEEKLTCSRVELKWVVNLDLSNEHLKSIGRADIFQWCPRLRFLTVDMNKLTTLRGVLEGGEDCLEHLSAKDNLLKDIAGLEDLHKLTELHLDGNSLAQLGFSLKSPTALKSGPVIQYCWSRLQVLTVGGNCITNIMKVGSLSPNLEVLDIGSNQLATLESAEGNALTGLHRLRVLDVGQNRLKGKSLWNGLEHCPELVSIVASRNKLRDLPTHFGSVLLRELWLNGNAIKRFACKAWLPSLQRLYLQDNLIDMLESLWGCPALEVLDLSFNSISDLSYLQHLSSFPSLRSLQLNDNPVSEDEAHAACVLQAVPWLAELDNEAVTKASRDSAIAMISKRIMDVVGLQSFRELLSRGEGFSNLHNVLNGEASLWGILSEVKHLAVSSSIIQDALTRNAELLNFEGLHAVSDPELVARSNMIAYQQMTLGLKGRLHAATKSRFGSDKEGFNLEWCLEAHSSFDSGTCRNIYSENTEYKLQQLAQVRRVIRLQALFRGFLARVQVRRLKEERAMASASLKAAMWYEQESNKLACRIQSFWRGWKVRQGNVRYRAAAVAIQACWKGHDTRRKLRLALDTAKYVDDDMFEYVSIDESKFLADGEMELTKVYQPIQSLTPGFVTSGERSAEVVNGEMETASPVADGLEEVAFEACQKCESSTEQASPHLLPDNLNTDVKPEVLRHTGSNVNEQPKYFDNHVFQSSDEKEPWTMSSTQVKKKAAVEELTKDWGFKSQKTVQALLKAREKKTQQAKEVAQRNLLQDPELRLRRFKEKVQAQPLSLGSSICPSDQGTSHLSYNGSLRMPLHNEQVCPRLVEPGKYSLKLPRSLLQAPKKMPSLSGSVEDDKIKKEQRRQATKKSTRDFSALHLPTIVFNTAF